MKAVAPVFLGGDNRTIDCQQPGEIMPNDTPSSHPLLSCTDRLAVAWQDFLILFGRILLGWIFMQSAWRKFGDMPAFIKSSLTERGVPVAYGDLLGYVAAPVEFFGGVCILLGLATRYAALLILCIHHYCDADRPPVLGHLPAQTTARSTPSSGRTSRSWAASCCCSSRPPAASASTRCCGGNSRDELAPADLGVRKGTAR